jgi:undecaprenyl-diphosphatase
LWVFRKNDQYKTLALELFWPIVFAIIVCLFLNFILPFRPRPEDVSSFLPLIPHIPDNSFPSMHAIFAGASFMSLLRLQLSFNKLSIPFYVWIVSFFMILGVIMILSRVFAGIHYPGDIFVGYLIWLSIAYVGNRFILPIRFFQNIAIEWVIRLARFFHL